MHTVVETPAYLAAAKSAKMTLETKTGIVEAVAAQPGLGIVMRETGGFRKFRFAEPGRGKSGGYRIVTFYSGPLFPVFLITVFAKGERDNLSKAERNSLAAMAKILIDTYTERLGKGTK